VPLLGFLLGVVCAQNTAAISVEAFNTTSPFPHVWAACVGSGHAALALRSDWRAHLAMVHRDLGFQRVRFHGIFDDDMNVVLPTGTSFYNVFSVYDYILSIGMTPYVELGFTPGALRVRFFEWALFFARSPLFLWRPTTTPSCGTKVVAAGVWIREARG
jgi:hypothetical protein